MLQLTLGRILSASGAEVSINFWGFEVPGLDFISLIGSSSLGFFVKSLFSEPNMSETLRFVGGLFVMVPQVLACDSILDLEKDWEQRGHSTQSSMLLFLSPQINSVFTSLFQQVYLITKMPSCGNNIKFKGESRKILLASWACICILLYPVHVFEFCLIDDAMRTKCIETVRVWKSTC